MTSLTAKRTLLTTLFATLVLSGCSLFKPKHYSADTDWAFRGKMAVRNATEASSFNVHWVQMGARFEIELSGPLGQGAVTIKGKPGAATLYKGEDSYQAPSLSALVYETTELALPMEHLQFWVRAEPAPWERFDLITNEAGQVTYIEQAGWQVNISDYFADDPTQPRKLSFARAGDTGKLVIREWKATQ